MDFISALIVRFMRSSIAEGAQNDEEQVTRSNAMRAGERVNKFDTPMQFCERKVVQGVRSSR